MEREKSHRTSKRHNLTFHPCHCAKVVRRVVDSGACVLRVQRSTARFLYTSGALMRWKRLGNVGMGNIENLMKDHVSTG